MQIHECSVSPYGQCARRQQNLCAADHNLEKRCSAQIFQPLSQTSRADDEREEIVSARLQWKLISAMVLLNLIYAIDGKPH